MPHKWLCSISWHLFLNSTKTPAHRMLCMGFFSYSISVVPQLFETCCGFEFFKLPPVMKITLIACLWNIQSETEYAGTITNRWRLTFYILCFVISSFLWLLVGLFSFFFFLPDYLFKFWAHTSIVSLMATSWSEKRLVSIQATFNNHLLSTSYVPKTSVDVGDTGVNLSHI